MTPKSKPVFKECSNHRSVRKSLQHCLNPNPRQSYQCCDIDQSSSRFAKHSVASSQKSRTRRPSGSSGYSSKSSLHREVKTESFGIYTGERCDSDPCISTAPFDASFFSKSSSDESLNRTFESSVSSSGELMIRKESSNHHSRLQSSRVGAKSAQSSHAAANISLPDQSSQHPQTPDLSKILRTPGKFLTGSLYFQLSIFLSMHDINPALI